jgi:hypothetical protein
MRKFLKGLSLVIPCISFFIGLYSQTVQRDGDTLYWTENYRLAFSDFQGRAGIEDTALHESLSKIPIHAHGGIRKGIDVRLTTKRGETTFTINAGMQRKSSWIKAYHDTISLKHEQGHFDICEIYARTLRREIKNAKSLSEAKEIFDRVSDDEELEQERYDKANTSQYAGISDDWSKKIINSLKELDAFQSPIVTLPIDK